MSLPYTEKIRRNIEKFNRLCRNQNTKKNTIQKKVGKTCIGTASSKIASNRRAQKQQPRIPNLCVRDAIGVYFYYLHRIDIVKLCLINKCGRPKRIDRQRQKYHFVFPFFDEKKETTQKLWNVYGTYMEDIN